MVEKLTSSSSLETMPTMSWFPNMSFSNCRWSIPCRKDDILSTQLILLLLQMRCAQEHKYLEYHSVCPLVRIGTPPPPFSQASVPPPKGVVNTGLRVRGWGVPIRTTGEKKLRTLSTLFEVSEDVQWRTFIISKYLIFLIEAITHLGKLLTNNKEAIIGNQTIIIHRVRI